MVSADEAREIAGREYAGQSPGGEQVPLGVVEFDAGYLVMPILPSPPPPPPGEPRVPTVDPGGSVLVVDKRNGSTMELPYLGDEGTADLYRRERRRWWR